MKRTISVLLTAAMLSLFANVTVLAAMPSDSVAPCWDNVNRVTGSILYNASRTQGTVNITIEGNADATSIMAVATLYYMDAGGSWVRVSPNWDYYVYTRNLVINETFDAVPGTVYKVVLEAFVYVDRWEPVSAEFM